MGEHTAIGFELAQTTRRWRARADERLAPLGLTEAKWVPLSHLSHAGGALSQRKLAEQTGIEGPSLVRILDELERLNLVERRDNEADRRSKTVHLTDKATPVIAALMAQVDQLRQEILSDIPEADLDVFHRVLLRISTNLGALGS